MRVSKKEKEVWGVLKKKKDVVQVGFRAGGVVGCMENEGAGGTKNSGVVGCKENRAKKDYWVTFYDLPR